MTRGIAPFCSRAPSTRAMASRNSDCRMGFNKYAATPSSWHRAPSPRWPAEVSIMIVAVDNSGLCRICSIREKPSIFGMCMSVKTSAYGSPTFWAEDSCALAPLLRLPQMSTSSPSASAFPQESAGSFGYRRRSGPSRPVMLRWGNRSDFYRFLLTS